MKILITGGSGLLALNWAAVVRHHAKVYLGLNSKKVKLAGAISRQIDINSIDGALRSLRSLSVDLVVHTAGLTSVENCEADLTKAIHRNVVLVKNISQACCDLKIKLIHISTDHLFNGAQSFVGEGELPNPRNNYALTKAQAELCALQTDSRCLILRTNFYGWGTSYRKSFSDYILQSLKEGGRLKLFQDIFFTPILAESLVLAAMKLAEEDVRGVVNLVGDTRISKFDFGVALAREFQLDDGLISPTNFKSCHQLAPRPLDMSLDNTKAIRLLGRAPSSLKSDLMRLRQQEDLGLARELAAL